MIRRHLTRQLRQIFIQPISPSQSRLPRSYFPPIRIAAGNSKFLQRSYSTATEASTDGPTSDPPPSGSSTEGSTQPSSHTELEAKNREIIDLKDKYLRSVAEFRNLQDRTQRDIKQARQFALTGFARDLIDSVDNLDRALSTVDPKSLTSSDSSSQEAPNESSDSGSNKALNDLYQGLKMTDDILMQTLKKHGLERIDPTGEKFDPNVHDAAFMTKMEGKEDGTVFEVIQKGFLLNGRVVRAAKVGVVKNK